MNIQIIQKVNSILDCISNNSNLNCKLYYGGFDIINEILVKFPSCRTALVCSTKSYFNIGKNLLEILDKSTTKFVSLTIDSPSIELEKISELFNLSEDVRTMICTDNDLINMCSYYCANKNIKLIVLPFGDYYSIFNKVISIKTGNKADRIKVNVEKYIILNNEFITNDISNMYSYILSKLSALIDYRIYGFLTKQELNRYAYSLAKNAVINVYKSNNNNIKEILEESILYIGIANAITDDKLFGYSALTQAQRLYPKINNLYVSLFILDIYNIGFNSNLDKILVLPDYNKRAQEVSKVLNIGFDIEAEGLLKQTKYTLNDVNNTIKYLKTFKNELNGLINLKKIIINKYLELGGNYIKKVNNYLYCLKHSGDVLDNLNGMSLMRDFGVLDCINE